MYLSIVRWDADNYVDKYQECATQEEADAHVAFVAETFPNAFSADRPAGGPKDWLVDPAAETVSHTPKPVPDPTEFIVSYEEFEDRFTEEEVALMGEFLYAVDDTGKPRNVSAIQSMQRAIASNSVDLLHSKTDTWLSILVDGEVITDERKTVILTP